MTRDLHVAGSYSNTSACSCMHTCQHCGCLQHSVTSFLCPQVPRQWWSMVWNCTEITLDQDELGLIKTGCSHTMLPQEMY
ncbi:hypothetical protein ANANG_G00059790 [Anguilla anguilla]|uniref:Uncharacterized protein n=1 Tax=Anguilla anguilla TaxID=7936 RepID=A0A9D3S4Z3_ANGAN|nr:hypothetical protein ANANG_G00059790 [Anguilla anguilla]